MPGISTGPSKTCGRPVQTVTAPTVRRDVANPPRPPLAFRVGIVGHRPDARLKNADLQVLAQRIHAILGAVRDRVNDFRADHPHLFASEPTVLRAISPLAEGTDRIFAEEALDLGFELCSPMPFAKAEYEKDFSPPKALEKNSSERFNKILSDARERGPLSIFELDGDRANEGAAYGANGRVVLNQSDLLLVVWDGMRLGKPGGTEETFDEARRRGAHVIWIDAHAPHPWEIVTAETPSLAQPPGERAVPAGRHSLLEVAGIVQQLLAVPTQPAKPERSVTLGDFYAERKPRMNPALLWRFFRDLIGSNKLSYAGLRVQKFEDAVVDRWPRNPTTPIGRVLDRLRPYYAWPDKLAVWYSDAYRSAFILAYLLAAAAVGFALLPVAAGWLPVGHGEVHDDWRVTACVIFDLVTIFAILGLVLESRSRRWHERWFDYRLAAELVRHLSLVGPLGGGRPFPQVQAHLATYGHPGGSWAAWYVRAVERHLGLPTARVDGTFLAAGVTHLTSVVQDQQTFHETTAKRSHRIEHRLHMVGIGLLALTLVCCVVHLVPFGGAPSSFVLSSVCAFLPALGAAFAGINNHAEFRRVAKRSEATEKSLGTLRERAEKLAYRLAHPSAAAAPPNSVQLVSLATDAASLMLNEVLDWRIVFMDRPPVVPS